MVRIHPTALVDPKAELDSSVEVGPFSVIGPNVRIGAGTRVGSHTVITGHTTIGRDNRIFQFASLGEAPQDKKYAGEPTRLEIGDRNTIRECVTLNAGTVQDRGVTTIGNDNWIMAYVHVAHDCIIGNHVTFANSTQLAGHVEVGDWVTFGGFTGVHQYCKVGAHVMTSVGTVVLQDIPPYVLAAGDAATPRGINAEGLKRRGFQPEQISAIRRGFKTLYRSGLTLAEAREQLKQEAAQIPDLQAYVDFLAVSTRGIIR